jgi:hypothetical protein
MNLINSNDLSLFETTKLERQDFAQSVIKSIKDGLSDPLKVHYQVKCMEDVIKNITGDAEYKSMTINEAAKYGKSFEHFNARFEVKEMGVKYDYSVCNDPVYNKLKAQLTVLEDDIKAREKYLKAIPTSGVETLFEKMPHHLLKAN